ncbi:MAG: RagB/SusD family nutrient uptake outer membrane protein [Cyclobacteriaceae bacterium]
MNVNKYYIAIIFGLLIQSCETILEPEPVDLLIDKVALNEAADVEPIKLGMYASFRGVGAPTVLIGDFTADMLEHNGTFTQYLEFGNKQITSSNAAVASLWGNIYNTIYITNFVIEKLDDVPGVPPSQRNEVMGTAYFLRGLSYFIGTHSFGDIPMVLTTDIETNKNIERTAESEILDLVEDDLRLAQDLLPEESIGPGFASLQVVNAALARFYLYQEDWARAAQHADVVINSEEYELEEDYQDIVLSDFTDEAIFELGYSVSDDPGTSATGLNNLFIGRREIIPSNRAAFYLTSDESGDRELTISFDSQLLEGEDNGWSVAKYGTADEDNNNIVVFRLAEMYLIRAEARAQLDDLAGAQDDINLLRNRANAPTVSLTGQSQALRVVEFERLYELAYEGHRWYDLVRTNRTGDVMVSFSENWKDTYELLPIPLREIRNNPALAGQQNPGYK